MTSDEVAILCPNAYAWIWRDSGYWHPINAYELVETAMEWHGLVGGDLKIPKQDPSSQEPHRSEQVAFLLKEEPVKHCIVATIHEETAIYFLSNHHEITWNQCLSVKYANNWSSKIPLIFFDRNVECSSFLSAQSMYVNISYRCIYSLWPALPRESMISVGHCYSSLTVS